MDTVAERKRCSKCGEEKGLDEFGWSDKAKKYRRGSCKPCYLSHVNAWKTRNPDKLREHKRREYRKNRQKYLDYNRSQKKLERWFCWKLKREYGITPEDYYQLVDEQNGVCAICHEPPSEANGHQHKPRLHVDHNHKTGKVRGLLCNCCNAGLGYLRDDTGRLLAAIQYLQKNSPKETKSA